MPDFARARDRMVDVQIAQRGVRDQAVLAAMRRVPREAFVEPGSEEFAYEDRPLPIRDGQTISQPYVVARMIEVAQIKPGTAVLEVGAGSGYAAAVMAQIAGRVHTIERQPSLAQAARQRFAALGYHTIDLHIGDGTKGWPEAAPFDAIVVAAGGPVVPSALKEQLAIGGRLVIPVGAEKGRQTLRRITRRGTSEYEEEVLGSVAFVPLVGEQGWAPEDPHPATNGPGEASRVQTLPAMIAEAAEPLPDFDDPAFGRMFDRFGACRVVLLGEASHGTSEFYRARAAITRRLIEEHGFTIVAVEADWPDAAVINHVVHELPSPTDELPFQRFPAWMWRNTDVRAFVHWLGGHNRVQPPERQAGFYGLDLYSLNDSIQAVIAYLDRVDPEAAALARERYGCLKPWGASPESYGRMALKPGFSRCEQHVVEMLEELNARRLEYAATDADQFLDAAANARLVRDAEAYYRAMYHGSTESCNVRDRHMFDTLCQLLEAKGPAAKAVVWAHNSHIGDARFTDMGEIRDELNIGQLCRERFGAGSGLIGFGTHTGTVAASDDWDEPMEIKPVNPSLPDSYERLAHDSGTGRFLLDLREGVHGALREKLLQPRLERFIGVIYRPDTERWSHYAHCTLPRQFDAYVWFDETSAVTPLAGSEGKGPDETFPFGL